MLATMRPISAPALAVFFFLLTSPGCKERRSEGELNKSPESSEKEKPAEVKAKPVASWTAIASEEEVQATLTAWLKAQNEGRFADYEKLYASRFTGTKRVGVRMSQFNRATWLKDRARMFGKPFSVTAKETVIRFAPGVALMHFTQDWKSATFADSGKKRLVLVKEGEALRISTEEMLNSEGVKVTKERALDFDKGAIAVQGTTGPLLLMTEVAQLNWVTDRPIYVSDNMVERAMSDKATPAKLVDSTNARYEIFDRSGRRCELAAQGLKAVGLVVPHFGMLNAWNARFQEPGESALPVPKEKRALDLWRMAHAGGAVPGLRVAVQLEASTECTNPIWGRKINAAAEAVVWTVRTPSETEQTTLLATAKLHPLVKEWTTLAQQEDGMSANESWLEQLRPGSIRVVESPDAGVWAFAQALGQGGCSYATPPSSGLLWRRRGPRWAAVSEELSDLGDLVGAADLNGDGEPEFIFEQGIYLNYRERLDLVVDQRPLYLDCPC